MNVVRITENVMKMKLKGRCTRRRPDQSGNNRLGIVLRRMNIMWRGSKEAPWQNGARERKQNSGILTKSHFVEKVTVKSYIFA
jgi:hypothetical protein